jgi:hypothetical protein
MRTPMLSIVALALALGTPAGAGEREDGLQESDLDLSSLNFAPAYNNRGFVFAEKDQYDLRHSGLRPRHRSEPQLHRRL